MTTPKAKFAGLALIAAICAGFTLGLTAPAWADWVEALAAYQRGDYAMALREWRPLAEQGNATAQFNLGNMYIIGLGVPLDYAQAHMWYNLATSRYPPSGDRDTAVKNRDLLAKKMTPAQISEAQKLAREWKPRVSGPVVAGFDEGVAAANSGDFETAYRVFLPLALAGDVAAQNSLGIMYFSGRGVRQDYAKAMKWYKKAAKQGYTKSQHNLGFMYDSGQGVPQDSRCFRYRRIDLRVVRGPSALKHFGPRTGCGI